MTFYDAGVVIIGRNEGRRLAACLASVTETRCVVYVDSGSTDGSPDIAKQFNVPVVRLSPTRPFTAARARNEGYSAIKKLGTPIQFVQFIDGDCELISGWLSKALSFIRQHSEVAIVCGRRRERYPSASPYNRLCELEWNTPVGEALSCGGDSLVRTDAFDSVQGFRSELMAHEEPELCIRMRAQGWRIWRLDTDMTLHDANISRFGQWWARTMRSGYGFAEVSYLHTKSRIGEKEVYRAILWGAVIPVAIGVGAIIQPTILWLALMYPLQVARVAFRKGPLKLECWLYAFFVVLGKFAEIEGILKYHWRRWRGHRLQSIEYKN